jgi:hypothetical protein
VGLVGEGIEQRGEVDMVDNVIRPEKWAARIEDRPIEETDPTATERKHRRMERARLQEILSRCGRKRPGLLRFNIEADKVAAARALGRLFQEAVAQGIAPSDIKLSCPKIYRFMLLDEQTELHLDKKRQQKKRQQKKRTGVVKPYLDAAAVIANHANFNREESLIRTLRDTTRWQRWGQRAEKNGDIPSDDEAAQNVAHLLHELSASVIRSKKLNELFALIRAEPASWTGSTFVQSPSSALASTAYDGSFQHWSEAPPLPSVLLTRRWHGGFAIPVRISSPKPDHAEASDESGYQAEAELHLYRDIRLALAPTVNANTLGPLFESRASVKLTVSCDEGHLTFELGCDLSRIASASAVDGVIDGRHHRVHLLASINPSPAELIAQQEAAFIGRHVESPFLWDHTPLADEKNCFENHDFSWTPVDAAYVAHWLGHFEEGAEPLALVNDDTDHDDQGAKDWVKFSDLLEARPEGWSCNGEPRGAVPLSIIKRLSKAGLMELAPDGRSARLTARGWERERRSAQTGIETWYPQPVIGRLVELAIYDGRLKAAIETACDQIEQAFRSYLEERRDRMRAQTADVIAAIGGEPA